MAKTPIAKQKTAATPKKAAAKKAPTGKPASAVRKAKTAPNKAAAKKAAPKKAVTATSKAKATPAKTPTKKAAAPKAPAKKQAVPALSKTKAAPKTTKKAPAKAKASTKKSSQAKSIQKVENTLANTAPPKFSKDDIWKAWEQMVQIRRFEERAGQLYAMGKIGGFCHLYIGQEAIAVGMQKVSKPGDQVITGYRDHAHMLACGMDAKGVMAELTGRRDGYSGGKGGSMHMFSVEKNFYGGHGIVGAQVPIGTGLALANQYRGGDEISYVYFGDGAANQGQVYESFNMAELWKLPVVYIIENNRYAMGTSIQRASAQTNLSQRGVSFNIPGEQVDGMDVEAVYDAGQRAAKWVREGNGPIILEMLTYRYRGHSMSDPAKYRKREEVDEVRERTDPIMLTEEKLITRKIANEEKLKARRKEIFDDIADAVDFALESQLPDPKELATDILAPISEGAE